MSKKGLISSLVLGLLVTLSLGIYTIVCLFGTGSSPKEPLVNEYNVAFRDTDVDIDLFDGFSEEDGTLVFSLTEGQTQNPLKYNEETGKYDAVSLAEATKAEVTAEVTLNNKGDKNVYHITVYRQGDGSSEENPWIVASKQHLVDLANEFNASASAQAKPYVKIVSDIDLGDMNWQPIGWAGHEYNGTIDATGATIYNLKINVNEENYTATETQPGYMKAFKDGLGSNSDTVKGYMDLGLFGALKNATINGLSVKNAEITINKAVYDRIHAADFSNTEYKAFARITVGTIAGYAEDSEIVGGAENKSEAVSRIYAFSAGGSEYAHGLGGVIGTGKRVRILNYSVSTNITNTDNITLSNIGGVAGYLTFSYTKANGDAVTAADQNVISNVDVAFTSSLLYSNDEYIGGVAGAAYNTSIKFVNVTKFVVNDVTSENIEYTSKNRSKIGGIAAVVGSVNDANADLATSLTSAVADVNVSGIDVLMRGGDAAGAIYYVGNYNVGQPDTVTDKMVVENVTVSGKLYANTVAGFASDIYPGVTVQYTKAFANPVVDVQLTGSQMAGFASNIAGKVLGFVTEDETPVKTKIRVSATGVGYMPKSNGIVDIYNYRTGSWFSGFVGNVQTLAAAYEALISNFDISVVSAEKSANYAGVAYNLRSGRISAVDVNANFTSADYTASGEHVSSTYMVAGIAAIADAGSTIENCNVILNANNNHTAGYKYAASFVGGLVARYTGDNETAGLTLSGNTVGGDVYFNDMYIMVKFDDVIPTSASESRTETNDYDVFIAAGLVGFMAGMYNADLAQPEDWNAEQGAWNPEYVDAFAAISYAHTRISDNHVSDFVITFDVQSEDPLGPSGYKTRAIGATIGSIYTLASEVSRLDLSTNTVANVQINAYETTFTYEYVRKGNEYGVVSCVTILGGNLEGGRSYGVSYNLNAGLNENITDATGFEATFNNLEDVAA